jgi:hypothetical protein
MRRPTSCAKITRGTEGPKMVEQTFLLYFVDGPSEWIYYTDLVNDDDSRQQLTLFDFKPSVTGFTV